MAEPRATGRDGLAGASQQDLGTILAALHEGVVVHAADGRILAANAAAERILGVSAAEMIGRTALDSAWPGVHADGTPLADDEQPVLVALRTRKPVRDVSIGVPRPDGNVSWLLVSAEPVDDDGSGAAVVALILDETQRVSVWKSIEAAVSSIDDVIVRHSPDSVVEWVSPTVRRIFGYEPHEVIGSTFHFSVDEDDAALHRQVAEAIASGGTHTSRRLRARRKDGSEFWAEVRVNLVRDPGGTLLFGISTYRDITEQVEAQDLLRATLAAEIDPHVLLAPIRDGSGYITDFDCIDASEAAGAYLGRPVEALIGGQLSVLCPPPAVDILIAWCRDVATSGEPLVLDGAPLEAEGLAAPLRFDARAVRVNDRVSFSWRDSTERYATIAELEHAREEFRRIAEHAADFVVQFDAHGVVEWVSPSVTKVIGWAPEELVGLRPDEFTHPDERNRRLQTLQDAATAGVPDSGRVRVRRKDGGYHWLDGVVTPVEGKGGGTTAVVVGFHDVQTQVETEQALADAERLYRLVAENASDVVLLTGIDGTIEWASPSVTPILGWQPHELVGLTSRSLVHPDDADRVKRVVDDAVTSGVWTASVELRFATASGRWTWMLGSGRALVDESGTLVGGIDSMRTIDDAVRARQALEQSERLFRTAMHSAAIGMVICELDLTFREVNEAFCHLVGRDEQWLLMHALREVVHPDDLGSLRDEHELLLSGEKASTVTRVRLVRPDGELVWSRGAVVLIRDSQGRPDFVLAQVEDVTIETAQQEQLAYQAFHDPLTGLRNRAWILDILEVDLRTAKRRGTSVGVLFVDLDNFKVVNDSLGHAAGDEVIATVADRVSSSLRTGDRVGRFGGDEFIVVVPDVSDPHEVERVAERVSSAIATDLRIEGHRIVPTASIGIALSTATSTPESLLRDTDSALYRAKDAGRGRWRFFDDVMHDRAISRLTVEDQLRDAVARGEFVVHYQPIVRLADRSVGGHEALVRWQHPTRGLLQPEAFLEVAEESSVVSAMGRAVLGQVCDMLVAHPEVPGSISVNVSAVELATADWLEGFLAVIDEHGVSPERLVVEVTETAVMSMLDPTRHDLVELRRQGIGLHVDDFGTGFSSISLLRDLPVSGLKLDRRFVNDLTAEDSPPNALANGLAGLVDGLHLVGVAEGIETEMQAALLLEQGWAYGQGYLFGRPAPAPLVP